MKLGEVSTNVKKSLQKPCTTDLTWAAGFIEGEGHLQIHRERRLRTFSLMVSQINKWPIYRLQSFFGGNIGKQKRSKLSNSSLLRWAIHGARARGVIMTLYKFFSPKLQNRAREALIS